MHVHSLGGLRRVQHASWKMKELLSPQEEGTTNASSSSNACPVHGIPITEKVIRQSPKKLSRRYWSPPSDLCESLSIRMRLKKNHCFLFSRIIFCTYSLSWPCGCLKKFSGDLAKWHREILSRCLADYFNKMLGDIVTNKLIVRRHQNQRMLQILILLFICIYAIKIIQVL